MLDLYGQQSVYSKDNFKSQKYKIKLTQRLLHVWLIFTGVWILVNLTSKIFLWLYTGTEPGLEVRGGKSINKKKKNWNSK